jgi:hypothetical protein
VLERIKALHDRKNHDYAQDANPYSNFEYAARVIAPFLPKIDGKHVPTFHTINIVFATMIGIKLARLAELQTKDPLNESVRDTHDDLANYAAIWASYWEE